MTVRNVYLINALRKGQFAVPGLTKLIDHSGAGDDDRPTREGCYLEGTAVVLNTSRHQPTGRGEILYCYFGISLLDKFLVVEESPHGSRV